MPLYQFFKESDRSGWTLGQQTRASHIKQSLEDVADDIMDPLYELFIHPLTPYKNRQDTNDDLLLLPYAALNIGRGIWNAVTSPLQLILLYYFYFKNFSLLKGCNGGWSNINVVINLIMNVVGPLLETVCLLASSALSILRGVAQLPLSLALPLVVIVRFHSEEVSLPNKYSTRSRSCWAERESLKNENLLESAFRPVTSCFRTIF